MDQAKVSRIQKPSKLKAPQIKTAVLQSLNDNVTNRSANTIPKSSTISTKSNSLTNLAGIGNEPKESEATRLPKILKPLGLRTIAKTENAATSSRNLHRRSKTLTDLGIASKSKAILRSNPKRGIPPAVKITNKRKADTGTDEVKPKIVKQVKIPDWDYKGRFNQLQEKYLALQDQHKKCKKVQDFDTLEEKYNDIKNKYGTLQKEHTTLSNKHIALVGDNSNLKTQVSELTEAYENLRKNFDELDATYKETFEQYEKLSSEVHLKTEKITELSEQNRSLQSDILKLEITRRKLNNTVQDLKGNIRVFCRVRPPISDEENDKLQCVINFTDEKTIEIRKSKESISTTSGRPTDIRAEFTLDKVFEPNSTQQEIFDDLSQLVQSALDGYDVCVFAYGQTGSGKTYTMQGGEYSDNAGMIPRAVDLIFKSIDNLKRAGWNYDVSASFLEIYNENVRDLLNPNVAQNLEIRFNEGKGTTVMNLSIQNLSSADELKNLMMVAQRNRAVAATDFNEHSSRSHSVTKIYLRGFNSESGLLYTGSINLVDLAGSESAKTSSTERLTETKNINKSLSILGSVMLALYNKEKHIPYRNSKLTYLLQSCLGGTSKTLMVVNIAPFEECFTESVNSLRFAAKVKEVKTISKRNKNFIQPASNNTT